MTKHKKNGGPSKPENLQRYYIYSINADGTQGVYLGDVFSEDAKEALAMAESLFLKTFKHGIKVVDSTLN